MDSRRCICGAWLGWMQANCSACGLTRDDLDRLEAWKRKDPQSSRRLDTHLGFAIYLIEHGLVSDEG